MTRPGERWLVCVDTGGTFTDCVAVRQSEESGRPGVAQTSETFPAQGRAPRATDRPAPAESIGGPGKKVKPIGKGDKWAVKPSTSGVVHRAKVLSSGCVRASVIEVGHGVIRVRVLSPVGGEFFEGWQVRRVGGDGLGADGVPVTRSHYEDGLHLLSLDDLVGWSPGDACDLFTGEAAPVLAARVALGVGRGPLGNIEMRLATTRGTNALLEQRGGPAALFISEGFADLLEIGTQQRMELFSLRVTKARSVDCTVVEMPGRLDARGTESRPLQLEATRQRARELVAAGVRCAAVSLMHAWQNDAHERAVAAVLREEGFEHISLSCELGRMGYLARTQTTLVNAYLAGVVGGFVQEVRKPLGVEDAETLPTPPQASPRRGGSLMMMTSAGGLVSAATFNPKDSLLSGPAAGVVGALASARMAGLEQALTFDMGGTSTDVARLEGRIEYVYEHRVGNAAIMAPAVAVESVAAGGGSVCWFDGAAGALRVGPQSAGAAPGPACYGAGGPLTITDVNVLLGRVAVRTFGVPLDEAAARRAAAALLAEVRAAGRAMELAELLESLRLVANEQMAAAMRRVSAQQGFDPAEYAIVAFGGAGGQHACGVAELLGATVVVLPRDVGLLSARGLLMATVERFAERAVMQPLESMDVSGVMLELEDESRARLRDEVGASAEIEVARRLVGVRLAGQEGALSVEFDSEDAAPISAPTIAAAFARQFTRVYGYAPVQRTLEVESVRVVARAKAMAMTVEKPIARSPLPEIIRGGDGWARAERDDLAVGQRLAGPAVVSERHATAVVEAGWELEVAEDGALIVRMVRSPTAAAGGAPDSALQELLTARLTGIAAEMGEALQRTALSTNIKDRLDFSCAVLDADGSLVVNAPHIPVHLGALGLCVRLVKAALPIDAGDVVVTNHPAYGGSHLPDVTVIAPVFARGSLVAFVAARAHHAEIGGTRPGSMPPEARTLAEEGVVIPPMYLVRGGVPRLEEFRAVLLGAEYPTRAGEENLADVQAQMAAVARGVDGVAALSREFGERLLDIMRGLRAHSRERVVRALDRFSGGRARVVMDDGAEIEVAAWKRDAQWVIEISGEGIARGTIGENRRPHLRHPPEGAGAMHPFNLNAPLGVVRSAVMYVLRAMVDEALPLNDGVLEAVDLRVKPGMLNPVFVDDAARCPAVAGGNVETSQRLVEALLRCFGLAADSHGTMNNIVFGNARFGYYETVGGGAGAGPGFQGTSAVHTHMTNTRITDPEVMERRYPVRIERSAVRRGSGGAGTWYGGDGIEREYVFLEDVSLSLLTQHRASPPRGMEGGADGACGMQELWGVDGICRVLAGSAAVEVRTGERLVLRTPGGGGWGPITQA